MPRRGRPQGGHQPRAAAATGAGQGNDQWLAALASDLADARKFASTSRQVLRNPSLLSRLIAECDTSVELDSSSSLAIAVLHKLVDRAPNAVEVLYNEHADELMSKLVSMLEQDTAETASPKFALTLLVKVVDEARCVIMDDFPELFPAVFANFRLEYDSTSSTSNSTRVCDVINLAAHHPDSKQAIRETCPEIFPLLLERIDSPTSAANTSDQAMQHHLCVLKFLLEEYHQPAAPGLVARLPRLVPALVRRLQDDDKLLSDRTRALCPIILFFLAAVREDRQTMLTSADNLVPVLLDHMQRKPPQQQQPTPTVRPLYYARSVRINCCKALAALTVHADEAAAVFAKHRDELPDLLYDELGDAVEALEDEDDQDQDDHEDAGAEGSHRNQHVAAVLQLVYHMSCPVAYQAALRGDDDEEMLMLLDVLRRDEFQVAVVMLACFTHINLWPPEEAFPMQAQVVYLMLAGMQLSVLNPLWGLVGRQHTLLACRRLFSSQKTRTAFWAELKRYNQGRGMIGGGTSGNDVRDFIDGLCVLLQSSIDSIANPIGDGEEATEHAIFALLELTNDKESRQMLRRKLPQLKALFEKVDKSTLEKASAASITASKQLMQRLSAPE